jgi:hypothetical protein
LLLASFCLFVWLTLRCFIVFCSILQLIHQ